MKLRFPLVVLTVLVACDGVPKNRAAVAAARPAGDAAPAIQPVRPETSTTRASERSVPQGQSQNAHAIAKPWIDDAQQLRDSTKRAAAVAAIRAAIGSSDTLQAQAGLIALHQTRNVAFDKKPFRALVLPHLAAADDSMRIAAMVALDAAGREQGDLERILSAAEGIRGEERNQLVHVIATFSDGELIGAAGAAVSKIIASDDRTDVRRSFSGLWGTHVSPAIEKRLLDLSNGPDHANAHDALYFGLSTLRDKSEAVIDRLVTALSDPDANNSGRALWGLGQGVPTALQPKVADALLQLIQARSAAHTRHEALRQLRQYGVERHAAALEALAAGSAVDAELRRSLLDVSVEIRRRSAQAPK